MEDFDIQSLDYYQELYEKSILFLENREYTLEQRNNISKGKLKNSTKGKPNYKRRGQSFKHSEETKLRIGNKLRSRISPIKGIHINRPFKFNEDPSLVISYYIKEDHSMEEYLKFFNCSYDSFLSYLKRNNISKPRFLR